MRHLACMVLGHRWSTPRWGQPVTVPGGFRIGYTRHCQRCFLVNASSAGAALPLRGDDE